MRPLEEILQQAEFLHDLHGGRMDRVAAKVAQKIRVLFQHEGAHTCPTEQIAEHHAGRSTAGDAALGIHRWRHRRSFGSHGRSAAWYSSPEAHIVRPALPEATPHDPIRSTGNACSQQAGIAVAGCGGILHGGAGHHHSQHGSADHRARTAGGSAEHESRVVQLHAEPGGFHTRQRLDRQPLRHATGVFGRDWCLHARIVALRPVGQHPSAGGVPDFSGDAAEH